MQLGVLIEDSTLMTFEGSIYEVKPIAVSLELGSSSLSEVNNSC